ncbi:MAG: polar amino acid transport system substrate-binding protein [Halioglobus sp.]|jgi:polar amino acid transport system substrate-binding protein
MSKRITRILFLGTLALTTLFSPVSVAGDTLQRVVDFKVLNVGMSGKQPPMNVVNKDGQLMGFDVDLARALATAMKVKLEIKIMPFGELEDALQNEKIDMIISGMGITPERTERASFVGPYMLSGKSLLTKDSVLANAEDSAQFNRKDLKLVALENSTSSSFIRSVTPESTLIEVEDYKTGVAMVISGEVDGMVADMLACVLAVMQHPDAGLRTLSRPITIEPIGIAISKDDPQFLNLVENYLNSYEKMGVLTKLRKKWLEDKSWIAELP